MCLRSAAAAMSVLPSLDTTPSVRRPASARPGGSATGGRQDRVDGLCQRLRSLTRTACGRFRLSTGLGPTDPLDCGSFHRPIPYPGSFSPVPTRYSIGQRNRWQELIRSRQKISVDNIWTPQSRRVRCGASSGFPGRPPRSFRAPETEAFAFIPVTEGYLCLGQSSGPVPIGQPKRICPGCTAGGGKTALFISPISA